MDGIINTKLNMEQGSKEINSMEFVNPCNSGKSG